MVVSFHSAFLLFLHEVYVSEDPGNSYSGYSYFFLMSNTLFKTPKPCVTVLLISAFLEDETAQVKEHFRDGMRKS